MLAGEFVPSATGEGTMERRFLVLMGCIAAVLVTAFPATANNKPTAGTQISLFSAPATFPADTPFYIEHGSACDKSLGLNPSSCVNASTHFDLYLDGVLQPSTVDVDQLPPFKIKRNLTNYPAGLPAGSHTFVGVFIVDGSVLFTPSATITFT